MADNQAALVHWLSNPDTHVSRPQQVEHLETHISHVFLAGNDVYKLKKPVKFDFLDFSTSEARERACRDELRLNRRLAHDVYLDVLPVTQNDRGDFAFHGDGQVQANRAAAGRTTLDAPLTNTPQAKTIKNNGAVRRSGFRRGTSTKSRLLSPWWCLPCALS